MPLYPQIQEELGGQLRSVASACQKDCTSSLRVRCYSYEDLEEAHCPRVSRGVDVDLYEVTGAGTGHSRPYLDGGVVFPLNWIIASADYDAHFGDPGVQAWLRVPEPGPGTFLSLNGYLSSLDAFRCVLTTRDIGALDLMTAIQRQLLAWPNMPDHAVGVSAPAVRFDLHKGRIIKAHPCTELSELDQSLRSVLKRLRFSRLRNVAESPLDWPSWLTIFIAWANQFCFRPADCGDLDVGMTVLQSDLPHGGFLLNFVLGNCCVRNPTWYPDLVENSDTVCDYSRHALCLCTVICLPRGSLPSLPHEKLIFYIKDDMTPLQSILFSLISRCENVSSRLGIITDGVHTIFVRMVPARHRLPPARNVHFQQVASSTYPLAYCIFAVMSSLSRGLRGYDEQLSGAPKIGLSYNDPAREFRDFDMFHLEIDRGMYWKFLQWKNEIATRAVSALPPVGSVFALHRRDVLSLENGMLPPLRCNSPTSPLSDATRLALDCRLRPMNQDLCAILGSQESLAFHVSEIKQQGPNMWSQVYFGRLGISGGPVVDEEVCLKLFDERLFPVPSLERYDDEEVGFQLSGLRCADVLLRQEESVYARLSAHHGRQLPWCYGFHQFTLSDGQTVVGVLLEKIKGETLGKTLESLKSIQWSTPHALNLLRRIRHLTKVLTHAGIKQADWHEDQIICIPQAEQPDSESVCDVDLVMLDFAFATQVWGQEEGAMQPDTGEIAQFARMLQSYGASEEMLADAGWNERDECETDEHYWAIFN